MKGTLLLPVSSPAFPCGPGTVSGVTSGLYPVKPVSGYRVGVPDIPPVHSPVDEHEVAVGVALKAVWGVPRVEPPVCVVGRHASPVFHLHDVAVPRPQAVTAAVFELGESAGGPH